MNYIDMPKKVRDVNDNLNLTWKPCIVTNGLKSYQINTIKIKHEAGTSVEFKDDEEKNKIKELYTWHFIWSKYYFYKKHYGLFISIIYFLPILLRSLLKIIYYTVTFRKKEKKKYEIRINGLISSMKGLKSFKRI